MELTNKQRMFCQEYLIDLNATQAAIRSGYSVDTARSISSELLTKPNIEQYIQELMSARSERTKITADKVLRELARIGFGDARNLMDWSGETVVLKNSEDLSDDDAAMVSEVSSTTTKDGGSIKLKTHDKLSALEKIGKHLKLFTDVSEVNTKVTQMGTVTIQTNEGGKTELSFDIGEKPDNG